MHIFDAVFVDTNHRTVKPVSVSPEVPQVMDAIHPTGHADLGLKVVTCGQQVDGVFVLYIYIYINHGSQAVQPSRKGKCKKYR